MKYLKKENILCFSKKELMLLYKESKISELIQEMTRRKVSFEDLQGDQTLMQEIANIVGDQGATDRDEHEIFAALFLFSRFYTTDCEICFGLNKNFNPESSQISILADLNCYRDNANISDFMINSHDGLRAFQLKRYRGVMDTKSIFTFIHEKVIHYANNLGDTNLLIQLQPTPYSNCYIKFQEIHKKLSASNLTFKGEILISYNHNNEKHILVQVYPGISKHEIFINPPSEKI
jgi:hypothetical protein